MADLSRGSPGDAGSTEDDRGQLVLVAGLALAVVLLALVLLANTAIYTENLATREDGVGERDVLGYRASVVDGEYDSRTALEANVSDGVARLDGLLRGSAARRAAGARVDTDATAFVEGALIRRNGTVSDPDPFTKPK